MLHEIPLGFCQPVTKPIDDVPARQDMLCTLARKGKWARSGLRPRSEANTWRAAAAVAPGPQPTFARTVIAATQFPEPAFRDIAQKNWIREGQQ